MRDTLLLIGVAYVAKFWAIGHRTLVGAADARPAHPLPRPARAARRASMRCGRSPPLMRPAILAAWLAVFVLAFHELTMSSLLYGPGTATLAVVILNLQQLGDVATTSALAVVLTAIWPGGRCRSCSSRRRAPA